MRLMYAVFRAIQARSQLLKTLQLITELVKLCELKYDVLTSRKCQNFYPSLETVLLCRQVAPSVPCGCKNNHFPFNAKKYISLEMWLRAMYLILEIEFHLIFMNQKRKPVLRGSHEQIIKELIPTCFLVFEPLIIHRVIVSNSAPLKDPLVKI